MKTSLTIATFLVLSAGAASAGAIVSPYQGSDTLFNVTTDAIAKDGTILPANAYVGGGSGNGQTAMVGGTQVTSPMSRMMNNGSSLCTKVTTEASGIVIGLDAVDVVSSLVTGGSVACNGTADHTGTGLIHSGGALGFTTWKQALALIYGGEANPNDPAHFRCDGPNRAQLVANWSSLFQNGCTNTTAVCNDATHAGVLWHAFRRDDASGTSDVFASVLGLAPSTSASSNNGFGASPYCNALNWETANGNGTNCALGANKQFVGPGGVADPIANDGGLHRRPPPGTWGDATNGIAGTFGADVLPTSMQDNDPIRRPCIGTTLGTTRPAEDVCNIDGSSLSTPGHLGLVLAVAATDYIPKKNAPLVQYPTNSCNGSTVGVKSPSVLTCAPLRATKHNGLCPNGDTGVCFANLTNATTGNGIGSQCLSSISQRVNLGTNVPSSDGRAFNLWMFDGTTGDGTVGYIQQTIPTATVTLSLDSGTGIGRIHSASTIPGGLHTCQLEDATDQIGCLVQADQCSIGFAGDGGKTWGQRANPVVASGIDAIRVNEVSPTVTTVQLLGKTGEYELSRKLYFASLEGFAAVSTGADADEFKLAKDESTGTFINPILTADGFFTLGPQSPEGLGTDGLGAPFCEDFNQATVCPAQNTTNDNACARNPAGVPSDPSAVATSSTTSTVCGNGNVEAYEECDHGTANGTAGNNCSLTCRCVGAFPCP